VINYLIYPARNLPRTTNGTSGLRKLPKGIRAHGVGQSVGHGGGETMKRSESELWAIFAAGMVICEQCGTVVPAKFGEAVGGRWVCMNCVNAECIAVINSAGATC